MTVEDLVNVLLDLFPSQAQVKLYREPNKELDVFQSEDDCIVYIDVEEERS